jgi:hypothetical protein
MVSKLCEHLAEHACLDSLAEHLHRRGIVPSQHRSAVDAFNLGLAQ